MSGCGITIIAAISASSMICAVVRRSYSPRPRETANAGERDDQQQLAELRGLELQERQRDPARRPVHLRHPVDDDVGRDQQPEGDEPVLTQPRVVEPGDDQRADQAEACVRRLMLEDSSVPAAPLSVTSEQATSPSAASMISGSIASCSRGPAAAAVR